ncbi:MAG: MerR family transcriptional regulator [Rhizorhabdus sp.]|uniref:MerR family transcriptional regulator n=1 Tax=Rhizorhabdus sp. TaxID=1968843 RepID=UPI001B646E5C|nr:MerR family transcriptional regulator [Rhizorhabdus sp.]MBP8230755.1 MerR family transcriptional regulator [Rhizorhabdus sp.]
MEPILDIATVARKTGVTSRALRFYEARGLIRPLRTASGRRAYGAGELARLDAILTLKRAGFSLSVIAAMLSDRKADLGKQVAARLAEVDLRAAEIAETRLLLQSLSSRIDRGETIDVATLCSLIRRGDEKMSEDKWQPVLDRFYSVEERQAWVDSATRMPDGFDQQAYAETWKDLGARIEAALPLDPAGARAQAYLAEWRALLEPFARVASPEMMAGAERLYDRMDEWQGEVASPFSSRVWAFVQAASAAEG